MYSQCPDCQTRFRVTAESLRAAHGTVRCGRCGAAFDALVHLSDSVPPASPVAPAASFLIEVDAAATAGPSSEYHFSAEDLERVFVDERAWSRRAGPPPAADDDERDEPEAGLPLVVDETDVVEDITLEGERLTAEAIEEFEAGRRHIDSTDEFEVLRDVPDSAYPEDASEDYGAAGIADDDEPAGAVGETGAENLSPAPEPASAPTTEIPREAKVAVPADVAVADHEGEPAPPWVRPARRTAADADAGPEETPEPSSWKRLAWGLGSLLLALSLAAQLVHHYRQALVRHPQIGPALRLTYERLGLSLLPNWDLEAFELRQWGNDAGAAADGRMLVRASITNNATFAQPYPILRLELQDRFGDTVATRDFDPAEYLKNPSDAARLVAPGSTTEAELLLADPGREAVGYRLDICLRESARLLRCATGSG
jgi:predicted Zn finger-like uncharacterized protein